MTAPASPLEERTFVNRLRHRLKAEWRRRLGPKPNPPSSRIPVALVGAGNVARWLYLPRLQSPSCPFQLCAVHDVQAQAAEKVAAAFHVQASPSVAALLDSPAQAVFVCTPPPFHKETVLAAVAAGKHVLCEKPLATSAQEARLMTEAAAQAGIVHMVNFTFRFRPDFSLITQLLQSEALGRVHHLWGTLSQGGWFTADGSPSPQRTDAAPWKFEPGGGVASDLGPHLLDLVRCWLGDIHEVRAWTKSFRPDRTDCEDACGFSLACAHGAMAHLLTSRWTQGHRERTMFEISGSEGALRLDQDKLELWTREIPRWRNLFIPPAPLDFLEAFHRAITGRPAPIPTFHDALKNNEALEAVILSSQSGHAVSLNSQDSTQGIVEHA
jgi:predicted dehydrogenase